MNLLVIPDFISNIGDAITTKIQNLYYSLVYDFISQMFDYIMQGMFDLVFKFDRLDQYINYMEFVYFSWKVAGMLLIFRIAFKWFNTQAGIDDEPSGDAYHGLLLNSMISVILIATFPYIITKFYMPLNQYLIKAILWKFNAIQTEDFYNIFESYYALKPWVALTQASIFLIGVAIISVQAGVRFVELLIGIVASPAIATFYVNDREKVYTFNSEMISIVFTQSFHVLLMVFMMLVNQKAGSNPAINFVITMVNVGFIVIAFKAPSTVRQLVYKTGVGSAGVQGAASMGRYALMKNMVKK